MKTSIKLLALATLTATLAAASIPTSAEAKGFRGGGHGFGHKFGGGHRFTGHRFGFGHHNSCWRFGKWTCGGSGY